LSSREIQWLQIDYKQIESELDYDFSYNTIRKNVKLLENKNLIFTQVSKHNQKTYSLNYDLINSFEIPNKFPNEQTSAKIEQSDLIYKILLLIPNQNKKTKKRN